MKKIKHSKATLGGKASNLAQLEDLGYEVPAWLVIDSSYSEVYHNHNNPSQAIDDLRLDERLSSTFGSDYKTKIYAVRSSAIDEDGYQLSFAGMYTSLLTVAYPDLSDAIIAVWKSVQSDHILEYRKRHGLSHNTSIAVIIQEMVKSDTSGVAFGLNPVSGNYNERIISTVKGLGDQLVSGQVSGDTYTIIDGQIDIQLEISKSDKPLLSEQQIREIDDVLTVVEDHYGSPQDVEFTYCNERLYLLQTRPVTAVRQPLDTLWDNSNIIESYPGITMPLTFSFIQKMYQGVYVQLVRLLGVSAKTIQANADIFSHTLGHVRGRVYYNLKHWYRMLALVPGYRLNAQYMETMMGVRERFETEDLPKTSKSIALIKVVVMIVKMLLIQITLPWRRRRFVTTLQPILQSYQEMDISQLSSTELVRLYQAYETSVLIKWKAPLVNDFFSMIWFGLLKKHCESLSTNNLNLHNDLLCGSRDIISVEPIRRTIAIVDEIKESQKYTQLFEINDPIHIWQSLKYKEYIELKTNIDLYLQDFGERCVGELKLETVSYTQQPSSYIKVLLNYLQSGVSKETLSGELDLQLRESAEEEVKSALQYKPFKRVVFYTILSKARDLVSNRENLRYERTKAFGVVRKLFTGLGLALLREGRLDHFRDVFFLNLEDLAQLESIDIKATIAKQKALYRKYSSEQVPADRFWTPGNDFSDKYIFTPDRNIQFEGDLTGIGCCPGVVQAKVRVITHPNEVDSLNGEILVTMSTDPGWVTLFPSAGGIIVQRGSLLSHSAIVSREMGIPCIVSAEGVTRQLKTGDEVLMDGSTGAIKLLNHA